MEPVQRSAVSLKQRLMGTWWLTLLWGIVFLILGLWLLLTPFKTATVLISLVAIFLLIDGVVDIIGVIMNRDEGWGWQLASGIIGVVIGILLLINPALGAFMTLLFTFYLLGIALIVKGIVRMIGGKRVADAVGSEWSWSSFFLGLLEVLIGLFFLANPLFGVMTLLFGVAILGIVGGAILIIQSFQMREQANKAPSV